MSHDTASPPPPEGFKALASTSPFVIKSGRFYERIDEAGRTVGCWIALDQCNADGKAHGGFLMTLADFALSTGAYGVTVSLTADFLSPVSAGDWVEIRTNISKRSQSLIFADAVVSANSAPVMRTSGIFRPYRGPSGDGES